MKKIALVTCHNLPEPDTDQEALLRALAGAGFEASMLAWDDPVGDPSAYDLCVIRSTWDYYRHPGSFLRWIERADRTGRLMNPGHVVRWNYHKRYLGDLAAAGVPVIPTVFFERGEEAALGTVMESRKWESAVVKPSVSAASFRTRRFAIGEWQEGERFLRELLKDRDAMVQQYMPAVEGEEGEKAIVWIDGDFTHAVRKSPRFAGADESVSGALDLSAAERSFAELALVKTRELIGADLPLMYGRVDVVRDTAGRLCVSEVELIEPSLFLSQHPPALERLVAAVEKFSAERISASGAPAPKAEPRRPFGRAPERAQTESFGRWRPEGPAHRQGDSRKRGSHPTQVRKPGRRSGNAPGAGGHRDFEERQPPAGAPGVWVPEGEITDRWKPKAGGPSAGRHGERRPGTGKATGWKPKGPGGGRPSSWKPKGPTSGKGSSWKPKTRHGGSGESAGWKPKGEGGGGGRTSSWKSGEKPHGGGKGRRGGGGGWKAGSAGQGGKRGGHEGAGGPRRHGKPAGRKGGNSGPRRRPQR